MEEPPRDQGFGEGSREKGHQQLLLGEFRRAWRRGIRGSRLGRRGARGGRSRRPVCPLERVLCPLLPLDRTASSFLSSPA